MIASNAVIWKLKTVTAIAALVGPNTPYRIYPKGGVPQEVKYPYIVVDSVPGQQNIGGHAQGSGSFRKTPLVIFCYADKNTGGLEKAEEIALLVDPAIAPTSGVTGSVQWNGTSIDHCTVEDHYEHIVEQQDGTESPWKAIAIPCIVYHLNC